MARTLKDLISVALDIRAIVSLDLERIEEDPIYQQMLITADSQETALAAYLEFYVTRERLFQNVPSTNGPGQMFLTSWPNITTFGVEDAPSCTADCA